LGERSRTVLLEEGEQLGIDRVHAVLTIISNMWRLIRNIF
jgi:hypothetical protein